MLVDIKNEDHSILINFISDAKSCNEKAQALDFLKGQDNNKMLGITNFLNNALNLDHQTLEIQAVNYTNMVKYNMSNYSFTYGLEVQEIAEAVLKLDKADSSHAPTIISGDTNPLTANDSNDFCDSYIIL